MPDSVLLKIFLYVPWHDQIKLEVVSTRWNNVLSDKSLRKIGTVDLDLLVKGDISKLPEAVHSLILSKHKIINSIIYVTKSLTVGAEIDTLNAVMSTCSSIRQEHLTSLKLGDLFRFEKCQVDEFSQFLNCFVNLEVLDLSLSARIGRRPPKIHLSQLVKLKELKGANLRFFNCRAHNLITMVLRGVFLQTPNDCNDFVQMMFSVAGRIEVLHLSNVRLKRQLNNIQPSKREMGIKFPKLSVLYLAKCKLDGITVDLVESRSLKRFRFCQIEDCVITNFNLSIHCLEYINIQLGFYVNDIDSQFLASAKADPQRLCLLEYFEIRNCSLSIVDLLDCFNPCYTYSLRHFSSDEQLSDSSGLIALIERCPCLNRICFEPESINLKTNDQVLIDLIIGTISLDIHVNGLCIERNYDGKYFYVNRGFISRLYSVLCLMDPMIVKCHNKVLVKVYDCDSELIKQIEDEFNIVFELDV